MKIDSVDDIDMMKIVKKIPKGTHRLRGFTLRSEKRLTEERKYVAAVRLTSRGPLVKFSRPNIEEVVENYTDLAFAVFHELLHVLEGHLDLRRIRDRYRLPGLFEGVDTLRDLEGNEEDASLEDRRRWKILHFVNELEIKHMEHVLLPDEFHEMNRRLYGEEIDRENVEELPDNKRILYRENEDFDSPVYRRLHSRVFSRNRYSPLEAYRVLDRLLPDVPDEEEEKQKKIKIKGGGQGQSSPQDDNDGQGGGSGGASGSGDEEEGQGGGGQEGEEEEEGEDEGEGGSQEDEEGEGEEDDGQGEGDEENKEEEEEDGGLDVSENDPLDHTESGIDEDAQDEDIQDLVDALEDMAEDENDSAGRDDGDEKSGPDKQQSAGGGHTLKPQVAEAKRQAPVRQSKNREVEEEIKKSGTSTDFHSKVASRVRDEVGRAIEYSVRPDFRYDHQARIDRKMGRFVSKYKQRRAPNEEKIALYYDISGSQTNYIPACNEIVLHNKRYLADQSIFLFTTELTEMKISKFSQMTKKGTVQSALSTYGTDFNVVVRHAKENDFSKIVVLTDDISEVDHSLIGPMIRGGELDHILVVCTERKSESTKEYSPGFIHGGPGGGYADEVVYVEPVTN